MGRLGVHSAFDIGGVANVKLQTLQVDVHVTGVDFRDTVCTKGRPLEGAMITGDLSGQVAADGWAHIRPPGPGTFNIHVALDGPKDWDKFEPQDVTVTVDAAHPRPKVEVRLVLKERTTQTLRFWASQVAKEELDFWNGAGSNQSAWGRLDAYFSDVWVGGNHWTQPINFPSKGGVQWCGIFATWCVRRAARPCAFWMSNSGPAHLGKSGETIPYRTDVDNVAIGDVVHFYDVYFHVREEELRKGSTAEAAAAAAEAASGHKSPVEHHGIVVARDGDQLTTIEGNTAEPTMTTLAVRTFTHLIHPAHPHDKHIDSFQRSVPD